MDVTQMACYLVHGNPSSQYGSALLFLAIRGNMAACVHRVNTQLEGRTAKPNQNKSVFLSDEDKTHISCLHALCTNNKKDLIIRWGHCPFELINMWSKTLCSDHLSTVLLLLLGFKLQRFIWHALIHSRYKRKQTSWNNETMWWIWELVRRWGLKTTAEIKLYITNSVLSLEHAELMKPLQVKNPLSFDHKVSFTSLVDGFRRAFRGGPRQTLTEKSSNPIWSLILFNWNPGLYENF